jgi:hypothetical protein
MADQVAPFLERFEELLKDERAAEIERTSLLLSNCSPRLLEKKGLAIGNLSIASVSIGLGGKRFVALRRQRRLDPNDNSEPDRTRETTRPSYLSTLPTS